MRINVVQVGNSRGIRIPKAILDQCKIDEEVDLEVLDGKIIIEPRRRKPREGWDEAFERMAGHGDDALFIDDSVDLDLESEDWQW